MSSNKWDVINDVRLFLTYHISDISQDILSHIFDDIQSDGSLQNQVHKGNVFLAHRIRISEILPWDRKS